MSGWFSRTPKTPKTLTTDEVIQWFHPLDGEVKRLLESQGVLPHIKSLTEYYNKPVATNLSTWTRLYADCLTDIGRNPNNAEKLEIMSKIFIKESGEKDETKMNKMTREAFVRLFAKTMDKIIKDEEKELELRKKQQMEEEKRRLLDVELRNKQQMEEEKQRLLDDEERNAEEFAGFNAGFTTRDTRDTNGGNPKKSKKKSRKRNASKRRNRRTRNYKKK